MKSWVKGFLILYLLLTVFQNMAASEKYEKYLKFFSGILLITYVITPLLQFSGQGQALADVLRNGSIWQQLESIRQESEYFEYRQSQTVLEQYEQAISKEVEALLQEHGLRVGKVKALLDEEYQLQEIQISVEENLESVFIEDVAELLQRQYQLKRKQIVFILNNGKNFRY